MPQLFDARRPRSALKVGHCDAGRGRMHPSDELMTMGAVPDQFTFDPRYIDLRCHHQGVIPESRMNGCRTTKHRGMNTVYLRHRSRDDP
ncbi:hypothetical protein MPUL_45910 [Mycolicibacterium pulveris]|uniref:Uncharacterized protein n=1 Tax=Mycolicibacterium pulveris TaxID=36813 RepID=A0A7I7URJ1_MYCPV|nr:hypothetical protein MPUL_45910 [Mycolicibacterium pulveris]